MKTLRERLLDVAAELESDADLGCGFISTFAEDKDYAAAEGRCDGYREAAERIRAALYAPCLPDR